MKLHKLAFLLLIVGGLNWLAYGLAGWDIGQLFGGMDTTAAKTVYVLVGLAAVYELMAHKGMCKGCTGMGKKEQKEE